MRVSLEGNSTESKKTSAASKSGKGAPLDSKQKIKAIVAVVVIIGAAFMIARSMGVFDSRPKGGAAAEPTPEQLEELAKQEAAQEPTSGNMRVAPMPLGSQ